MNLEFELQFANQLKALDVVYAKNDLHPNQTKISKFYKCKKSTNPKEVNILGDCTSGDD